MVKKRRRVTSYELRTLLEENKQTYFSTVRALVKSIDAKDKYTGGHCERVMQYAMYIADELQLLPKEKEDLRYAAILHDVGKIGIPGSILNKNGKLDPEEMTVIQNHTIIGYEILKEIEFLKTANEGVLHHHERIDGTGYPHGLEDGEISRISKILAVADAFDAMVSIRPYRKQPLTVAQAIEQLIVHTGTQFEGKYVEAFIQSLEKRNYQIV